VFIHALLSRVTLALAELSVCIVLIVLMGLVARVETAEPNRANLIVIG